MSATPPVPVRLAAAVRRSRIALGVRSVLLGAAAVLLPVWAYQGFDHYYGWHWQALSRAVRGGYVSEDWAGYLFQQPADPGYVNGPGDWFGNPFAFLMVTMILFAFVAWLLAYVAQALATIPRPDAPAPERSDSVLARAFVRGRLAPVGTVDGTAVSYGVHRRWVLLAVQARGQVPPVVLEAATTGRGRRVRPLRLSHRDGAVIEGEFLERWRIHSPRPLLPVAPRLLTPSVLQDLASIEEAAYVEAAGTTVLGLYPARALRSPERVTQELARLHTAADALAGAVRDAGDVAREHDLDARVGGWRTASLQLGRLVLPGWWSLPLLVGLVVGDFVEEAVLSRGVDENTMLLHAVVIGWLLMLRVRGSNVRWVRPRGQVSG